MSRKAMKNEEASEHNDRKTAAIERLRAQRQQLHSEAREYGEECGRDFVFDEPDYAQVKQVTALKDMVDNTFVDDLAARLWTALGDDATEHYRDQLRDRELPEAPFASGFITGTVEAWNAIAAEVER